jgi:hypothetical protein
VIEEEGRAQLDVRVSGGIADQHRISANDLATLATVLQTAVRGVGTVLSGGQAGLGGRRKGDVESATELQLVAEPRSGSLTLSLALPPEPPALPGTEQPHLGRQALGALLDGVASLDGTTDELPEGFDPGVLKTLDRLGPVLRRGHALDLSLEDGSYLPRRLHIDQHWLSTVEQLIAKPLRAHLSVEGVLQMVDLASRPLQCRIDRSYLPSVACVIPNDLEPQVREALGRHVRVVGEGVFDRYSNEPKRLTVERLELLIQVAGIDPERIRRHASWRQLAEEQNVDVLHDPTQLGGLFDDEAELEDFLASLRDPGPSLA